MSSHDTISTKLHSITCVNTAEAREHLSTFVDEAANQDRRVVVTRYGKARAALVPTDDLLVIEAIKERGMYNELLEGIKKSLENEKRKTIPLSEL